MAKAKSTCSIDGCETRVKARGFCCMHYKRFLRHGDPLAGAAFRDSSQGCSIEGCGREHYCKSLCEMHYQRLRKTGTPYIPCLTCGKEVGEIGPRAAHYCSEECKPVCRIDGCERYARVSGEVCAHHRKVIRDNDGADPAYVWASERKCVVCGKEGWDDPSGPGRKYCSWACSAIHHAYEKTGVARPDYMVCVLCGEEFSIGVTEETGKRMPTTALYCRPCGKKGNPEARRLVVYGVTPEQYSAALERGCEICGDHPETLAIDHDHKCCPSSRKRTCGQCVRGFLCRKCNTGIGMLRDSEELLSRAIEYLS